MIRSYYQIDYIDKNGYANFINSTSRICRAIDSYYTLKNALEALGGKGKYVLDRYEVEVDDNDLPIEDTDRLVENLFGGLD